MCVCVCECLQKVTVTAHLLTMTTTALSKIRRWNRYLASHHHHQQQHQLQRLIWRGSGNWDGTTAAAAGRHGDGATSVRARRLTASVNCSPSMWPSVPPKSTAPRTTARPTYDTDPRTTQSNAIETENPVFDRVPCIVVVYQSAIDLKLITLKCRWFFKNQ